MINFFKHKSPYLIFMALLVFADQFSKFSILEKFMNLPDKVLVINDYINIVLAFNKGVSFSLFSNLDARIILIIITSVITAYIFFLFVKSKDKMHDYYYSLIIAGAVGNIIDRIVHKAVVDFIDIHYKNYHWPAFNLADCLIVLGVIFLVIDILLRSDTDKKQTKERK